MLTEVYIGFEYLKRCLSFFENVFIIIEKKWLCMPTLTWILYYGLAGPYGRQHYKVCSRLRVLVFQYGNDLCRHNHLTCFINLIYQRIYI
jgi:hypothetical protein